MLNNVLEEQSDAAPQVLKPACLVSKHCSGRVLTWQCAGRSCRSPELTGAFPMLLCQRWTAPWGLTCGACQGVQAAACITQGATGGVEFGGRPAAPSGDSFAVPPPSKVGISAQRVYLGHRRTGGCQGLLGRTDAPKWQMSRTKWRDNRAAHALVGCTAGGAWGATVWGRTPSSAGQW
jgi:hypothetical protein